MTDAITATAAREDGSKKPSEKHIPGEPGLWILIFGDLAIFAILFFVYLQARGADPEVFAASQDRLNRHWGALNTLVLLTSSVLVAFAVSAQRSEQLRRLTRPLTLAGAGVGACFVVIKVIEYHEKVVAGLTPSANEFFTYYYVLTAIHLFHVFVGLGVLVALSRLAREQSPTRSQFALFEGGACFWHLVDLLWIVIFPLLYLVR